MPHDAAYTSPGRLEPSAAAAIATRALLASMAVAAGLSVLKLVGFVASGSVAVLASLTDSAMDFVASALTLMAVRYAASPADKEHRYGHGKAEGIAAIGQAGLVAMSAVLVGREAVDRVFSPAPLTHGGWAIAIMTASIVFTVLLIFVQNRAIQRSGSIAVKGDRAHYTADLASNVAVIVGVAASVGLGWGWADPVVGFGVAVWLLWGAWTVAREALDQMMDRELSDIERERIQQIALSDPRIRRINSLRTRSSGPLVHIQFHAELDPTLSLEQAHDILVEAEIRLVDAYPGADVIIHPDPEGHRDDHESPFFAGPSDT